jgi:hypothetical protein
LAKPNYQFERRQREIAKKKKQDEKRQRKLERKHDQTDEGAETTTPGAEPGGETADN